MPPNVWPSEIDGFRETFLQLFAAFDATGAKILSGVARHLGLAPDWFDDKIDQGNSILRLLHYPPVSVNAPGIRAGAHEDINLITLLLGAEEGGLELLTKSGNWIPATPPPGALVINVGDMLQRPHQSCAALDQPPRGQSATRAPRHPALLDAFFLHLEPQVIIEALPQTVSADNPLREPPISAHDYLHQRLRGNRPH